MEVTQSRKIQADPVQVYDYLMDIEKRKQFIPALDEVVLLDPLPIQEGSRYIEISTIAGRPINTTYLITKLEKGKFIGARTIKSVFPIESSLTLDDSSGSTHLTIHLSFKLTGLYKLAAGLIRGIVNQQAIEILNRIKRNVEN